MDISTEVIQNIENSKKELEQVGEAVAKDPGIIEQYLEELAPKALNFCLQVIIAIIVYLIGVKIIKMVRKVVRKALVRRDADQGVIQFLDSMVHASCLAVLILIILTMFGVTTASVVAILGSAGLAIGMSLQGSLSNFAGGVLILLLKPFKVGDYIIEQSSKLEGTVKEITIFYTKLRTIDERVVVLPNGALSDSNIINCTAMEKRQIRLTFGISYESDLKKAKEVLKETAEKLLQSLKEEKGGYDFENPIQVYVEELGDSAVVLGVHFYVMTVDHWASQRRFIENVKMAFDENGIDIPYQTIDINLNNKA